MSWSTRSVADIQLALRPMRPLGAAAQSAARSRQQQLLKPPGSLGRLEELAIWMAAVSGDPRPVVEPLIVIAATDHGVAAEGVSAYPQEVTAQMLSAFLGGGSAIAALAAHAGAPVAVVNAGVASPPPLARGEVIVTGLAPSANLAREPALSEDDLRVAIDAGRSIAEDASARGANLLIGGDMGIANTTPSTCLAAWLTTETAAALCGRGTGIDDEALTRKRAVVERALALHGPHVRGPLDALRRLGGGELAVICGLALGAGEQGVGFICDGLIATVAVAVAVAIAPDLRPRIIAGHRSPEPAHGALLADLGLEPILDLAMRLGEASGAATALTVVQAACAVHNGMATFDEAGVSGPQP
jgi:nicotinate-nucleotide--dimethylbenzimidazole phosphoribosyltransferase